MITSPKNPKVQHVRSLQVRARARRQTGTFVIEGVRLAEEALAARNTPELVLYTLDLPPRGQAVVDGLAQLGAEVVPVAPQVMQSASGTESPQGLLAVLPIHIRPFPTNPTFLLLLDGMRDPGNLGAILRTAAAAGVEGVLLPPGNVDPYAPKVARAAMGAHFRIPICALPWGKVRRHVAPLHGYLAEARAAQPHTGVDFCSPLVLIIGGEAEGAGPKTRQLDPTPVKIPMPGKTESLNAAIAAGILMFEVVRQRAERKVA